MRAGMLPVSPSLFHGCNRASNLRKNLVIKLDRFGECLQNAALKFRRSPSEMTYSCPPSPTT